MVSYKTKKGVKFLFENGFSLIFSNKKISYSIFNCFGIGSSRLFNTVEDMKTNLREIKWLNDFQIKEITREIELIYNLEKGA